MVDKGKVEKIFRYVLGIKKSYRMKKNQPEISCMMKYFG